MGIYCGAAVAAAVRLARMDEFTGRTIEAVMTDSAERHIYRRRCQTGYETTGKYSIMGLELPTG